MKTIMEIYEYREMIFSLTKRDLRGRYKGSVLGFLWTFVNPLLQLVVYTLVFAVIMRTGIEKYYLFLFVALVPWIFLSSSLTSGATCILESQDMVKKIYFPREVLPIANTLTSFVNMILSFIVVFGVLILTGHGINILAILYLPVIMLVEFLLALGIAFLSSALTVYLRDLQHILSICAMAWQFLTPIMYSQEMVEGALTGPLLILWNLNPATSIINAYREVLYYKQIPQLDTLLSATILGIVVLLGGYFTFCKLQRGFAEEM